MDIRQRLEILLPNALEMSRIDLVLKVVSPMSPAIWAALPKDEPLPIRCAMAERELLRLVPLRMSQGELLAGRLDPSASAPYPDLSDIPFPGGQTAHTALDTAKLLRLGISGVEAEIRSYLASTTDSAARLFYRSALISLEGFTELADRLRVMADESSRTALDPDEAFEMGRLAEVLKRVPYHPAQTFYEAIQSAHLLYFAATVAVRGLYGPGRLDRILYPYYRADLDSGLITRDEALQLICCQFILMNHLFTLPQPLMIGGLGIAGHDTTNELTYLCLEADNLVALVNPSLAIAVNEETPDDILDRAMQSLLEGRTKPSLFNDRLILRGLRDRGVPFEDAVDYTHSTCVEISVSGKSNILVASPYLNLLKPLEFMMNDGHQILACGPDCGNDTEVNTYTRLQPPEFQNYHSFEDFFNEYKRQLAGKIADAAVLMCNVRRERLKGWAFPLASCFTDDCIQRGVDMDSGGARYMWVETSCVGLANIADSLMVIKRRVFDQERYSLQDIRNLMIEDFPNEAERMRLIRDIPRYGNDDPEVDAIAREVIDTIYTEHLCHRDYTGGWFVPGFFCWIMHRYLGELTAATPDGRHSGDVLADGSGASQGKDTNGPTAAIRSVTSWDHQSGLGGIVLNLRFSPNMFGSGRQRDKLTALIRTYFELGGFEVQVNAVSTDTLCAAQEEPEKYSDLLVRIAGYSDYFTRLDRKMQEEIISRTEHGL